MMVIMQIVKNIEEEITITVPNGQETGKNNSNRTASNFYSKGKGAN
jgi:hypothetical protein